jgi:hypothetical protein
MAGHERITGTGLGLPIARDLARRMGGDLDVASVPGSGSAFVLVMAGPAAVDQGTISTTLERALASEEVGLEERAVLRAIGGRTRGGEPADGDGSSPSFRVLDGGQGRPVRRIDNPRPGNPTAV